MLRHESKARKRWFSLGSASISFGENRRRADKSRSVESSLRGRGRGGRVSTVCTVGSTARAQVTGKMVFVRIPLNGQLVYWCVNYNVVICK